MFDCIGWWLGWIYEFATEENQRYKEGRVILERALVTETEGMEEHMGDDWLLLFFLISLNEKAAYNVCVHHLFFFYGWNSECQWPSW